jgi:Transposase DDE domain
LTRWLRNEAVTAEEMISTAASRTSLRVLGRHVLAIQDTTVIRSGGGGGLYLHAMIAVDAADGAILGPLDGQFLSRSAGKRETRRDRSIEAKESYRWLLSAQAAGRACAGASRVTVIADRESDIYEAFTRRPVGVELLIRANKNRAHEEGSLFAHVDGLPVMGRLGLALPAQPGRRAREAALELRFAEVELKRPRNGLYKGAPPTTRVYMVDLREVGAPAGEAPVHWRLMTTHAVTTVAEAIEIANLYRRRWAIEQLFRTMKTKGFDVENVRIEDEAPLKTLAMAIYIAAVIVQQIVHARDGHGPAGATRNRLKGADAAKTTEDAASDVARDADAAELPPLRPLTDSFDEADQPLLEAFSTQLEGATTKQKNPHPKGSLAFASWVCARLGGWNCYYGKPGPITILNGWHEFQAAKRGVNLLINGKLDDV